MCSWIERLIVNTSILSKLPSKVNEIPIKTPARIFCSYRQTYLKMYRKQKGAKIIKTIFKTKKREGEFTYDRVLLVKTMLYFHKISGTG